LITLVKGTVLTYLLKADSPKEEGWIASALTYTVPNFWFMKSFKRGVWDGRFSFYNKWSKSFPTGLLDVLPESLKPYLIITDGRKKPECLVCEPEAAGIELRDYQIESVRRAIEKENCIITAPTNAGKTECGAAIIHSLSGLKTLWVTHRGALSSQTRERLENRLGESVGLIQGNEFDPNVRVNVGMVQTLCTRLKSEKRYKEYLHSVDVMILDECHHTSSKTWQSIAKNCTAYYRIGLSATPLLREEISNLWLIGLTGSEIKTVSNKELIQRGISAAPRIIRIRNVVRIRIQGLYRRSYEIGIEENEDRNKTIAGLARLHKEQGDTTLVLVNTIKHGQAILVKSPEGTVFLTGNDPAEYRDSVLHGLRSGEVKTVIATPIFDEGVDAPQIGVLILAGAGKSHLLLLQRLGRGMRKKTSGKNEVLVYDFEDRGDKYLEGHSLYRLKLYRDEGFKVFSADISFNRRVEHD